MTAQTRIAIASGSKAFTGLAVMRLVERGELRLDQMVRELLGDDLPLIDPGVTIEHLLTHTSGIGRIVGSKTISSPPTSTYGRACGTLPLPRWMLRGAPLSPLPRGSGDHWQGPRNLNHSRVTWAELTRVTSSTADDRG